MRVHYEFLTFTDFWGEEVYFPFYYQDLPIRKVDMQPGFNTGNHFPTSQMFKVGGPEDRNPMYVAFREESQLRKFISTVKAHTHLSPGDWGLVGAIQFLIRLLPQCSSSDELELQRKMWHSQMCTEYDRWVNPVTKTGASCKVHKLEDSSLSTTVLPQDYPSLGSAFVAARVQTRINKENPFFTPVSRNILEITKKDGQTLFFPILRGYHMAYNTIYPWKVPPGVAMDTFQEVLDFMDLVSPNVYSVVDNRGCVDISITLKATEILNRVSRELFYLKNRAKYFGATEDTRKKILQEVQKIYPNGEIFHQSTTTPYEFHSL
jgi:hypothetical protein